CSPVRRGLGQVSDNLKNICPPSYDANDNQGDNMKEITEQSAKIHPKSDQLPEIVADHCDAYSHDDERDNHEQRKPE
ncbi:hypothetical protein, partial [Acidithiobacillus ferriphilus]|uniref:hypothetical protein n=1 Tax=Acidithiobacillus ferriphilus TaxID=1689834 RepID=UPI001C0610F4